MPRTCIVLLTWNAPEPALRCLDALLPMLRRENATLVTCDNDSQDDTVERVLAWADEHFFPVGEAPGDAEFLLIQNGANLGYAAGNNVGIRYALQQGGFDAVWLLNQDTMPREDALTQLSLCAEQHPEVGVFGGTLIYGQIIQYAAGARYSPLTTIFSPCHGGQPVSRLAELNPPRLDYICGAAMYTRTAALQETGLLNEDHLLFYEELDLARRMTAKGWRLGWCRDSQVVHDGAFSTEATRCPAGPRALNTAYHENLSTLIFTARHHPRLLPAAAAFRFAAKNILALIRRNPRALGPLWKAYGDFFLRGIRGRAHVEVKPRIIFRGRLRTPD